MTRKLCQCQPDQRCKSSRSGDGYCKLLAHDEWIEQAAAIKAERDALRAEMRAGDAAVLSLLATVPICQKHKPLRFPACWQCRINATVEINRQAMASEKSGEGKT